MCECVCVLYCGNFLWAPVPWLMDTSCVLCLALSLQIYIKQRSTASVSLHLCLYLSSQHLPACLPASLTISCPSRPAAHFISFFISLYFFCPILIQSKPTRALCLCVHVLFFCLYGCCHSEKSLMGFVEITLILHRSSSLWLSTFHTAAEFDISFNSLSLSVSPHFSIEMCFDSDPEGHSFFLTEKSWHLPL